MRVGFGDDAEFSMQHRKFRWEGVLGRDEKFLLLSYFGWESVVCQDLPAVTSYETKLGRMGRGLVCEKKSKKVV